MANFDGQVMFALIVALVLAWAAGQLIARLYARKVLQLMQSDGQTMSASPADDTKLRQQTVDGDLSRQNRTAIWRLRLMLIAASILLAIVMAFVAQACYVETGFSWRRILTLSLVYAWPSLPAIGLLERWSRLKILLASLGYVAVASLIVMVNSNDNQNPGLVLVWLFVEQLPLLILVFVMTARNLRSVFPYLLLALFPLTLSSLAGLDVLASSLNQGLNSWVIDLIVLTNSYVVFFLFSILPWLLAFLPLRYFTRLLTKAYRKQIFSEPLYLLSGLWLINLLIQAMTLSHSVGFKAYGLLAAWLLLPASVMLTKPWLRPKHQPPTLLLLRVFRGDAEIERLFDSVIEKWRYSGNTVLIAGKDLALRNLDPDELFAFLSGHLQERFISDQNRLHKAIADLAFQADADGRYRINEFFCFDATWKAVLQTLIEGVDSVLMDLRGYTPQREGCTHELSVLAGQTHLRKLVILFDSHTDKKSAEGLLSTSTTQLTWLDCETADKRQLLQCTLTALLLALP